MGGGSAPKPVQYEPVKAAEEVMKSASQEASRTQALRRGIASTFSRRSVGGGTSSATSGTSSKLGS